MSNFLIDEDTDLLAAEFVLGTLDSEERANAQSLLRTDHGFIAMVRIWERRFGELHLMVEPVEPDAKIFERIKAKVAEIAPREPAPEGKPPLATAPEPPAGSATPEMPKPTDAAIADAGTADAAAIAGTADATAIAGTADATAVAGTAEATAIAGTADATAIAGTVGEAAPPQGLPVDWTPRPPAEPSATGEVPAPAGPPATTVAEPAAASVPGPEPQPPDTAAPIPVTPPPLVKPGEQLPDLKVEPLSQRGPDRREEITLGLVRSRRRWRVLGVLMTLLVVGLATMLAAWRFAPDRLPARLQPAEVMMSLGIEPASKAVPILKPAPPESQFDE
jgi:hypothetical protein